MDPTLERSFRGHRDGVTSVAFNPNMKQLVSGGLDATVMVWNFKTQMRAFRFVGHSAAVMSVAVSPAGNLIASGSKDRTVRLWIPTVKGESTSIKAHMGPVRSVAFSADAQQVLPGWLSARASRVRMQQCSNTRCATRARGARATLEDRRGETSLLRPLARALSQPPLRVRSWRRRRTTRRSRYGPSPRSASSTRSPATPIGCATPSSHQTVG